jgi:hypothetical protein
VPILETYYGRISSSLDAFETLSSSFVRAVPGALAGQVGAGVDARKLTSGHEGLQRLLKAYASASAIKGAMQEWGDSIVSYYRSRLFPKLTLVVSSSWSFGRKSMKDRPSVLK